MGWDDNDLLGDMEEEIPHEFFYTDFVGNKEEYELDDDNYEDEDEYLSVEDIDFSSLEGKDLKKDFKKINKAVSGKKVVARQDVKRKPLSKSNTKPLVKSKSLVKPTKTSRTRPSKPKPTAQSRASTPRVNVPVKNKAVIQSRFGKKTTERIIIPEDRKVIVEGVDKFILSNTKESDAIRNIGYYKGEKLKELVLIINNTTPNDFEFELFNPSMPLDYLFSSSQNLNNRILVAGDNKVSYSDMLFNMLANPTLLPNAKFTCTNPINQNQAFKQFNQPLIFKNKNIAGHEKIHPIQNALNVDIDQQQDELIYWDIMGTLGRAFIPDGMDIISYKVLAGNSVVFGFYYKQVSLKRFFFQEARDKNIL
jgi:hypothetical protein